MLCEMNGSHVACIIGSNINNHLFISCNTFDIVMEYVIDVTLAWGNCLICMPKTQGPQACGLRAYISGKSQLPMLQVICNIFGTSKIAPNLLYIAMDSHCDCGIFISTFPWCLFIHCIVLVLIMGLKLNMCNNFTHLEIEIQ